MIPTLPPSFVRLADGAYPIPAWHDPDPATHAEVFVEEPPEVPPGFVAELAEQPDAEHILRYTLRPFDLEAQRAERLAELAAIRYRHETAGVSVAGAPVRTDRQSQALVTGAYCTALLNPSAQIDWKGADGNWSRLDAATMTAIAATVSAHVQACFSRECALAELIGAAQTWAELAAIDLESGWPGEAAP